MEIFLLRRTSRGVISSRGAGQSSSGAKLKRVLLFLVFKTAAGKHPGGLVRLPAGPISKTIKPQQSNLYRKNPKEIIQNIRAGRERF